MCLKITTLKKVSFASLAFRQAQECDAILAALVLLQMSSLNQRQRDREPRAPCSEALLRDTQFDP